MNDQEELMDEARLPKMSLGDVIDRMSILTRKIYYGEAEAVAELEYLKDSIDNGELLVAAIRLAQMNFEIWQKENWLRKFPGDVEDMTEEQLMEAGRGALVVRDVNKKRIEFKNTINQTSGMGFPEFKIRHRSQ